MRIYEISKDLDVSAKDILEALEQKGFSVTSHMSALPQEVVDFIYDTFKKEKTASKDTSKKTVSFAKKQGRSKKSQEQSQVVREPEVVIAAHSVSEVADQLMVPVNDVIVTLLKWGIVSNKNQVVSEDVVGRLAEHYQVKSVKPVLKKEAHVKEATVKGENFQSRPPIVVIVGHVDHGKTTLLDFIRKSRVAAREKGGITQHLGAYQVTIPQGDMIFLDTPGHEAFSKIRMRGVKVADIVVLVVAADDGVMPQTVEAIKFAKTLEVPVVVAVTKMDKADPSRMDVVKRQLAQHDLLPEDWGGQIVCVPASGVTGEGVEQLLEMIVLQAEMMELQAEVSGPGVGYVLEAKIEKGRGPVATLISQHGKVSVGDYFVCGRTGGHVSSLTDSLGKKLKEVGPARPVQVAGFESLPMAGDFFEVVSKEDYRKALAQAAAQRALPERTYQEEGALPLIVKADNDSSKEAIVDAINKLSKKVEKGFALVSAAVGNVKESDIDLAANTGARVISFHVKAEHNALLLAQQKGVKIHSFYIIYKLLEFLQELADQEKEVVTVRKKIGDAEVIRVFDIKGVGVIAGCRVKNGRFTKEGFVEVYREGKKIGEGKIRSLQREKRPVKEVHTGFECGFLVDGFTDFEVGDTVHCLLDVPQE